jgi:hypothetical protein
MRGKGEDKTSKGSRNVTKTNKPYGEPEDEETYDHSKSKAPFDKGTTSKFPTLKSIGIDKLAQGSDVLNTIRQLDGNASGAIKSAIDMIQNLRKNGFGAAMDMIGGGAFKSASQQHTDYFGAAVGTDITTLIGLLSTALNTVQTATPITVYGLANNNALDQIPNAFRNQLAGVSSDIITQVEDTIDRLQAAPINAPSQYFTSELAMINTNFTGGMTQAVNSIMNQLNQLADTAGGPGGLVQLLGGASQFQQIAASVQSLSSYAGIGLDALSNVGGGAVGIALSGGGLDVLQNLSGSLPAGKLNELMNVMNQFSGNMVALKELSGGMNPETLSKIAIKYAKKQINDPQKKFSE